MKIKNLLVLTAMAAMAFTACNKDENGAGADDNSPKSVTLSLKNVVAGTRAPGDALAAQGTEKVKLNDLQVFFATSTGALKMGKTLDNNDATHYFSATAFEALNETQRRFHFLPAEVTKVIVVGNPGAEIEGVTTEEGLKKTLAIAGQQDEANLALYNTVDLKKVDGVDEAGHPLYKAAIMLEPRVSRIEIAGFNYEAVDETTPRMYESITVDQVVLNNYYTEADFFTGKVGETKINEEITAAKVFNFFATTAKDWHNDIFSDEETSELKVVNLNEAGNYVMTYEGKRPAYHFFPNAENIGTTNHPQLVVKLTGTTADGTKSALYLATNGFDTPVNVKFAQIYRVNFAFNDENLKNPEKCVQVSVDVVNWEVQNVNAEF